MRENTYMKKKKNLSSKSWLVPDYRDHKRFPFLYRRQRTPVYALLTCKRGPDKMDVLLDLFNILNFL